MLKYDTHFMSIFAFRVCLSHALKLPFSMCCFGCDAFDTLPWVAKASLSQVGIT